MIICCWVMIILTIRIKFAKVLLHLDGVKLCSDLCFLLLILKSGKQRLHWLHNVSKTWYICYKTWAPDYICLIIFLLKNLCGGYNQVIVNRNIMKNGVLNFQGVVFIRVRREEWGVRVCGSEGEGIEFVRTLEISSATEI